MKNIINIVLILVLILAQGCMEQESDFRIGPESKSNYGADQMALSQAPMDQAYGAFTIVGSSLIGNSSHNYNGFGYYFDQEMGTGGNLQDAGAMSLDGHAMTQRGDFAYVNADQAFLQNLYANPAGFQVELTGNPAENIPSYDFNAAMPGNIFAEVHSFSKSDGILITWNPSPQNDEVAITLRDEDYTKELLNLANDNGEYHIPGASLADFEVGEKLEIIIGRASSNGQTANSNGEKAFLITGLSYQHQTYVLQ